MPPAAAEILLGAAMWLTRERDFLDEEMTLAQGRTKPSGTAPFALADIQRLHLGLSRAIALLDGLAIDPTKVGRPSPTQPAAALQTGGRRGRFR